MRDGDARYGDVASTKKEIVRGVENQTGDTYSINRLEKVGCHLPGTDQRAATP